MLRRLATNKKLLVIVPVVLALALVAMLQPAPFSVQIAASPDIHILTILKNIARSMTEE